MVNRTLCILLIVLMSAQSLYQLGLVTYFELNRDYIAKVLCINKAKPQIHCNGQCYLKKKLQKTEDTNPTQAPSREKVETAIFLIEQFDFQVHKTELIVVRNSRPTSLTTVEYHKGQFRPPNHS